jgi:predicted enzyme related to lactoylglutathione lyase
MGPQHGAFCWNELNTRGVAAAKPFYAELFGWKYSGSTDSGDMPYTEISLTEGRPFGGMFDLPDEMANVPPFWMAYVAVDDVDASAKKVEALGGKIHREPTDIPGVGRFCIIADPAGAIMSMITLSMTGEHANKA